MPFTFSSFFAGKTPVSLSVSIQMAVTLYALAALSVCVVCFVHVQPPSNKVLLFLRRDERKSKQIVRFWMIGACCTHVSGWLKRMSRSHHAKPGSLIAHTSSIAPIENKLLEPNNKWRKVKENEKRLENGGRNGSTSIDMAMAKAASLGYWECSDPFKKFVRLETHWFWCVSSAAFQLN